MSERRMQVPIEIGARVSDLRALAQDLPEDALVRGSVVIWQGGQPVLILAFAPEYEGQ